MRKLRQRRAIRVTPYSLAEADHLMLRYLVANLHVKRNGFALLLTVQVCPNSWPSFLSRHLVEWANRVTGNDDDNTDRKLIDCLPRLPLLVCTASQICLSKEKPVTPKNRHLAIEKNISLFFLLQLNLNISIRDMRWALQWGQSCYRRRTGRNASGHTHPVLTHSPFLFPLFICSLGFWRHVSTRD